MNNAHAAGHVERPESFGPLFWGAALAGFILSRWWYHAQGVDFWSDTVYFFSQILDPPLLTDHLLQSLWYLHAQPPLFNLLTGVVMKCAPTSFPAVFLAIFLVIGFATLAFTALSLTRLGFNRWLALAVSLAFTCAPPFVIYENWYFYPHICMFLLAAAAWLFLRSGGRPGPWMQGAFWVLAVLVLTRSLFHPLYLVIAVAITVANGGRGARKALLLCAIGPLVVVGLLCLKNL
ncbi:MAG: hypothetical protein GXP54_10410, partial [Deltaproteobacteria bacterium]|nr:hypothetical protein [Deltaproteobacteria bacterium]